MQRFSPNLNFGTGYVNVTDWPNFSRNFVLMFDVLQENKQYNDKACGYEVTNYYDDDDNDVVDILART